MRFTNLINAPAGGGTCIIDAPLPLLITDSDGGKTRYNPHGNRSIVNPLAPEEDVELRFVSNGIGASPNGPRVTDANYSAHQRNTPSISGIEIVSSAARLNVAFTMTTETPWYDHIDDVWKVNPASVLNDPGTWATRGTFAAQMFGLANPQTGFSYFHVQTAPTLSIRETLSDGSTSSQRDGRMSNVIEPFKKVGDLYHYMLNWSVDIEEPAVCGGRALGEERFGSYKEGGLDLYVSSKPLNTAMGMVHPTLALLPKNTIIGPTVSYRFPMLVEGGECSQYY